jgi:hypothetical protein
MMKVGDRVRFTDAVLSDIPFTPVSETGTIIAPDEVFEWRVQVDNDDSVFGVVVANTDELEVIDDA